MEEKAKKIFKSTTEIFKSRGIKSMTMDDIAGELKISKKTLYKYVKDKNDLVYNALKLEILQKEIEFDDICSKIQEPIAQLQAINAKASEHIKSIHPSVVFDIKKYHPKAWEIFEDHKVNHIYNIVFNNLESGKKLGIYREEIDSKIISKFFVARFDVLFNPEIFPPNENALAEVNTEMMNYHLHGILNAEGLKQMQSAKKTKK